MSIVAIVIPSVIAIVSLVANVWMWRRSRPNQALSIYTRSFALLAERATSFESGVSVLYKETAVKNPFVVEVLISSKGRNDIPTAAFDDGKPMVIRFSTEILAVVSPPKGLEVSGDRRAITLSPRLLKRGEDVGGAFLCQGQPQVSKPEVPLVDVRVDVIDGNEDQIVMGQLVDVRDLSDDRKVRTIAVGVGLMTSAVAVLASVLTYTLTAFR